jgi:hypothetical protein
MLPTRDSRAAKILYTLEHDHRTSNHGYRREGLGKFIPLTSASYDHEP